VAPPYDGTLAKYYVNASDFCYKVPDSMTLEEAAMVEAVSVACAVCTTADLRAHQTVLVLGSGPIGVLCAAVSRQWGAAKVAVVDIVPARLEVAKSYGVDATYIPPTPEPGIDPIQHAEAVAAMMNQELGLGDGADVVLECTGAEPCVQLGIFAARKGGRVMQVGMGKEVVAFPITAVCTKGLSIKGSIRYRPGSYAAAIELISRGKIDVKKLVTNRFRFEQAEEAFELVRAGRQDVFKVMIEGVVINYRLKDL
jgi:D-xylulose reductase